MDRTTTIRQALAPFVDDEDYEARRYALIDNDSEDFADGADVVESCETFEEAVAAWDEHVTEDPDANLSITGWNHGVLAFHHDIAELFGQPRGTFACPICLQETPHTHTHAEIDQDRKQERELQKMRESKRKEILARMANIEKMYGTRPNLDAAVAAVEAALGSPTETISDQEKP